MSNYTFEHEFSNFMVKNLFYNKTSTSSFGSSAIAINNYSNSAFYNSDYINQLIDAGEKKILIFYINKEYDYNI